jgi:hypothetical protein
MLLSRAEAGQDPRGDEDLDPVRVELREVAERLRRAERKLAAIEAMEGIDTAAIKSATTHVRLLCRPSGYGFDEVDEPPPTLGELFDLDGEAFVVERFVPSPLPGDSRRCVVLVPAETYLASTRADGVLETQISLSRNQE